MSLIRDQGAIQTVSWDAAGGVGLRLDKDEW
jgi:hypothetical protein